jgi:hypothetical protein
MRRRWLLGGLAVVAVAGIVGGLVISRGGSSVSDSSAQAATAKAQLRGSPATPGVASSTVAAFKSSDDPLEVARTVGAQLAGDHTKTGCAAAVKSLASAGSPIRLRALAAGLADPLAGDLAGDVVTAETIVVGSCGAPGGASESAVATLRKAVSTLSTRLSEDGLR